MPSTLIFNLSNLVALKSIPTVVLPAFSKLLMQSQASVFSDCCPAFSNPFFDYLWVASQYVTFNNIIERYKLGTLTRDEFLNEFLTNSQDGSAGPFACLVREGFEYPDALKQRLLENKNQFYVLKDVTTINQLTKQQIAQALLIEAWNTLIAFDQERDNRLKELVKTAQENKQSIIFISNSEPLHAEKIFSHFRAIMPQLDWCAEINFNPSVTKKPIPLTNDQSITLCPSYAYGLHKTGTDGIIAEVAQDKNPEELTVVSGWRKDRETAQQLTLTNMTPEAFFESLNPKQQQQTVLQIP